jgi:hypothetical protein
MWQRLMGYQSMDLQHLSGNDWWPSNSSYTMPANEKSKYPEAIVNLEKLV